MEMWDRIKYRWDRIGYVADLIEQWDSSGCASEKECEDSLYHFLHDRLPEIQVVRQYGRGRAHIDLMVDERIMIEIKFNLVSTSEYQRLVGQLVDYGQWGKTFFLVLIGEAEAGLLKQLRKDVRRFFPGDVALDDSARIFHKRLSGSEISN